MENVVDYNQTVWYTLCINQLGGKHMNFEDKTEQLKIDIFNDFLDEVSESQGSAPVEEEPDVKVINEQIIINMYQEGKTLSEITSTQGVSYGAVYKILRNNNIYLRSGSYLSSKAGQRLLTMTRKEMDLMIKDYAEGMKLVDICSKYDINRHGLYTVLDENRIPRRKGRGKSSTQEKEEEQAPEPFSVPTDKIESSTESLRVRTDKVEVNVDLRGANVKIDITALTEETPAVSITSKGTPQTLQSFIADVIEQINTTDNKY